MKSAMLARQRTIFSTLLVTACLYGAGCFETDTGTDLDTDIAQEQLGITIDDCACSSTEGTVINNPCPDITSSLECHDEGCSSIVNGDCTPTGTGPYCGCLFGPEGNQWFYKPNQITELGCKTPHTGINAVPYYWDEPGDEDDGTPPQMKEWPCYVQSEVTVSASAGTGSVSSGSTSNSGSGASGASSSTSNSGSGASGSGG